ncbi:MAG: response regulator [Elusimicrobiota bacterium]
MTAKILLADDDEGWRELAGRWLRDAGYEVRSVGNGKGVLALAREFRPDGFVLDHDLGDTTGGELCETIKSDPEFEKAFVVIITAHAAVLPEVLARCPPDQFVAKTEQSDELVFVLETLLAKNG